MSSSEQKKQRNRRKYKKESAAASATASCQNDGKFVGLSNAALASSTTAAGDIPEMDPEKIINSSRLSSLEVYKSMSKIEQMMDSGEDPLPTLDISQGSNPYFSRQKCLICQRDQVFVSSIQTITGDGCDEIGVLTGCDITIDQFHVWVCADCRRAEIERKHSTCIAQNLASDIRLSPVVFDAACADLSHAACRNASPADVTASGMFCPCKACHESREMEKEDLMLHNCWASMQKAVRRIYHEEGCSAAEGSGGGDNSSTVCGEKLKEMVHRLCLCNPHQLFLWLECQCREIVSGMRNKLLKQLEPGTKSPQKAKAFVTALLDHYAQLCAACKRLHPILKELQDHLQKLNLNWELVNSHLFQSLVYADHRVQNALPTAIAQLRLPVDDDREQSIMTNLLIRYVKFDRQMRDVESFGQELTNEQATLKVKQRKLKEDWDNFRRQRKVLELKRSNGAPSSCSCDDCALKNLFSCSYITHQAASLGLDPELAGLVLHEAVDGCPALSKGFVLSSPIAGLDPLVSSNFAFSLDPRSVHSKEAPPLDHASTALHNGGEGRCKRPHPSSSEVDHAGECGSPPHPFDDDDDDDDDSAVASDGGDSREDNEEESDSPSATEEEEEEEEGDCHQPVSCGNGVRGCQCDRSLATQMLCLTTGAGSSASAASSLPPSPLSPPIFSSAANSSSSSPDKQQAVATDPHPCECHVCVHHADRATIPAVVSVPPRPAALHLYPHIHGSGGLAIHAQPSPPHLFKPLLHSHLYGGGSGVSGHALPPPSLSAGSRSSAKHSASASLAAAAALVVVPPLPAADGPHHHHHHHHLHNCTDYDHCYENTKLLLNSHKYGGGLLLSPDTIEGAAALAEAVPGSRPPVFEAFDAVDVDMSFLANYPWPELAAVEAKFPSPERCPVAAAAAAVTASGAKQSTPQHHSKANAAVVAASQPLPPPAHTTTSSKATQASGSAGGGRHLLEFQTGKQQQHTHNGGAAGSAVAGFQESEGGHGHHHHHHHHGGDGSACAAGAQGMAAAKRAGPLHTCGASGSLIPPHMVPVANKHTCISDSCACLPDASLSSGSHGSSCPNQDTDSYSGDPEESQDDTCSEQSSSTSTSNQKDNKHCDCCYCEVFGHDVASLPPLSRNYTEMRDKLRMRLSKKKMDCKNSMNIGLAGLQKGPQEDGRDIDSLICFINGTKKERNDAANAAAAAAVAASTSLAKLNKKSSKKPKKSDGKPTSSSKGSSDKGYSSDTTCCQGQVTNACKEPCRPERRGSPKIISGCAAIAAGSSREHATSDATLRKVVASSESVVTPAIAAAKKSNACSNAQPTPVVRKVAPPPAASSPTRPPAAVPPHQLTKVAPPLPKPKSRSEPPVKQTNPATASPSIPEVQPTVKTSVKRNGNVKPIAPLIAERSDVGNGKAQVNASTIEAARMALVKQSAELRAAKQTAPSVALAPVPSPRGQQHQSTVTAVPNPVSPSPASGEKKVAGAAQKKKRKASLQPPVTSSSPSPVTTEIASSTGGSGGDRQRQPTPMVAATGRLNVIAAPGNQRNTPSPRCANDGNGGGDHRSERQRPAGRGATLQQNPALLPAVAGATYVSAAHRTATPPITVATSNGSVSSDVNGSSHRRHQLPNNFRVVTGGGDKVGLLPHTNGMTTNDFRVTAAPISSPTKVRSRVVGNSSFAVVDGRTRYHLEMATETERNGSGGAHLGSAVAPPESNSSPGGGGGGRGLSNGRSKHSQKLPSSSSSNHAEHAIEDIFVPRDIDLDNGELDEMDREVEAFKRFCWNSVPVANKEKVHVNLKDIVIRKKSMLGCS